MSPAADIPPTVRLWAEARDAARAARDYRTADALRDRIAAAGYTVTDGAQGSVVTPRAAVAVSDPAGLEDRSAWPDGLAASVLLLLDRPRGAGHDVPAWVVDDATRCLSGLLATAGETRYEIVILDNGVGGPAADWAADAARNPGVEAVHLARPVGFAEARSLQQRLATGEVLVWLDTGVEPTGDLLGALAAIFADERVGLAGRWGGNVAGDVTTFEAVDPPAAGQPPVEVHAVWGYLLALRRSLVTSRAVALDAGFRFYRNADADLSLQVSATGARVVLAALPAVQHGHRPFTETPPRTLERESRRNYRRLLERHRPRLEALASRR